MFKDKNKFGSPFYYLFTLAIGIVVFSGGVIAGQENWVHFDIPDNANSVQKNDLPNKLDYSGVEEVYSQLKSSFDGQLEATKLEDGLKQGLVNAAGDPYTEYLNAEESKDFEEGLSGSFQGIGAELGKENDMVVIISPIKGFPAEKAGLKPKDVIVEIDGESSTDLSISEAVKKIRGPKGTKVKLGIVRGGKKLEIEITRDQITIPSVKSEITKENIGIIEVSRFGEDTAGLVEKAAKEFKSKNIKGLILDMRGNPGGILDSSVDVASLWLPKGDTILQEKRDDKVIKTHFSSGGSILKGIPTVVLINEGSASASEIVAGALRDNNAATIIGVKSYGKGSVQDVKPLDFGGTLKVTIARWFTPNGINIDKEGIKPDKEVKLTDKDIAAKKDPQKDAAIAFLRQ